MAGSELKLSAATFAQAVLIVKGVVESVSIVTGITVVGDLAANVVQRFSGSFLYSGFSWIIVVGDLRDGLAQGFGDFGVMF